MRGQCCKPASGAACMLTSCVSRPPAHDAS